MIGLGSDNQECLHFSSKKAAGRADWSTGLAGHVEQKENDLQDPAHHVSNNQMFRELTASQVLHGVLGGLRGRPDGGDYPLHMEQSTVHTQ